MTKIIKSFFVLGLVAVSAVGVARSGAWFTDQEDVLGNTIDTGTIDIEVDSEYTEPFELRDLKPSQNGYHEFVINNVGSNPANIYKLLEFSICDNEPVSEPEEVAETALGEIACDLQNVTNYDLEVWVYESDPASPLWHQTIYAEEMSVAGAYSGGRVLLGMVPSQWHMKVEQSYHMPGEEVGNVYQGDSVAYDMILSAEQLKGTVVLEDKETNLPETDSWWIQHDDVMGTLEYG